MSEFICDVIQWAGSTDREKVPATQLLKELPNEPGEKRERMIRDFILRGDVPDSIQVWCTVPVAHGSISGEFYCTPDYLCIGSDDDFVRVRINGVTAELVGVAAQAMLPTQKMVNDIYATASGKLVAQPWGPPYDHSMQLTERWRKQDDKINKQAHEKAYERGMLWAGHAKDVVIGSGLATKRGETIGIYGWFDASGKAIQGPGVNWNAHEWTYTDYSQCVRLIYKDMLVGEEVMSVNDVLQEPELAPLISGEGTIAHCSYHEFHPDYLY